MSLAMTIRRLHVRRRRMVRNALWLQTPLTRDEARRVAKAIGYRLLSARVVLREWAKWKRAGGDRMAYVARVMALTHA